MNSGVGVCQILGFGVRIGVPNGNLGVLGAKFGVLGPKFGVLGPKFGGLGVEIWGFFGQEKGSVFGGRKA